MNSQIIMQQRPKWGQVGDLPYWVSNTGLVKNKYNRVLKTNVDKKGYLQIRLCILYVKTSNRIHRLVAEAFLSNPLALPQVNHKDTNKRNNNVENLEWCSNLENMRHAIANGTAGSFKPGQSTSVKLDKEKVKLIRKLAAKGFTQREIASKFNIEHTTVWAIMKGKIWKHI